MNDLKPCPFCGGEVRWCKDDAAEPHDCDQITCDNCEYNIDCNNDQVFYACNLESARIEAAKVWNTRVEIVEVSDE